MKRGERTYGCAFVTATGNLTLSTADLGAGVLSGATPRLPLVKRNRVGRNSAAGTDTGGQAEVLGTNEASEGGSGDEKSRVQHG